MEIEILSIWIIWGKGFKHGAMDKSWVFDGGKKVPKNEE